MFYFTQTYKSIFYAEQEGLIPSCPVVGTQHVCAPTVYQQYRLAGGLPEFNTVEVVDAQCTDIHHTVRVPAVTTDGVELRTRTDAVPHGGVVEDCFSLEAIFKTFRRVIGDGDQIVQTVIFSIAEPSVVRA